MRIKENILERCSLEGPLFSNQGALWLDFNCIYKGKKDPRHFWFIIFKKPLIKPWLI